MRWYRGPEGDERLWLDRDEIELIIEDELRSANLVPTPDEPVVDLERFIEVHLNARLDQYADLDPAVLGMTEFRPGASPIVSINRDLTGCALDQEDSPSGALGRWRATLGHEGGHLVLHRVLFELDFDQQVLFSPLEASPTPTPTLQRCLKRDVGHATRTADWREVQANRGMAALLMPRRLFVRLARTAATSLGVASGVTSGSTEHRALAGRLAECFSVSRQAAWIRLDTLGFVTPGGAARLPA